MGVWKLKEEQWFEFEEMLWEWAGEKRMRLRMMRRMRKRGRRTKRTRRIDEGRW